jgi:hypothetical protein
VLGNVSMKRRLRPMTVLILGSHSDATTQGATNRPLIEFGLGVDPGIDDGQLLPVGDHFCGGCEVADVIADTAIAVDVAAAPGRPLDIAIFETGTEIEVRVALVEDVLANLNARFEKMVDAFKVPPLSELEWVPGKQSSLDRIDARVALEASS